MSLAGVVRGQGPPVLLVHGLGLCWQSWEPIFGHLADMQLHAIDLPGFGESPPLTGPVTVAALLDTLERHLDGQHLDRAHLVGNSLGGLIAMGLAARGRAYSVTAISPAGLAEGWARTSLRASILGSHAVARAGRSILPAVLASRSGRHLAMRVGTAARPADMTAAHATTLFRSFADSTVVRPTLDAIDGPDGRLLPYLERVSVPVTVVWGSGDLLLSPRQGLRVKREHPWVRLVRLPGAGHVPMTDDPEAVAAVIRSTVESAGGADA
jgi:pimeloyl-ACP methyl ester carboxylesterase